MRNSERGMRNNGNPVSEPDLKKRTKAFALRILKLVDALPKTTGGRALALQIVRSGTSVAANYRAACRAKSNADFIAKMGIVEGGSRRNVVLARVTRGIQARSCRKAHS